VKTGGPGGNPEASGRSAATVDSWTDWLVYAAEKMIANQKLRTKTSMAELLKIRLVNRARRARKEIDGSNANMAGSVV